MSHAQFILFRNGRHGWCAAPLGFRNVLQDPIGYGQTRVEAASALLAHPEFIRRAQMGEWPLRPSLGAFVEAAEATVLCSEPQLRPSDMSDILDRGLFGRGS